METITEMDLARLVFGADEMKCESAHEVTTCSGEVVAIKETKCGTVIRICRASRDYNLRNLQRGNFTCTRCDFLIRSCWTIRPI